MKDIVALVDRAMNAPDSAMWTSSDVNALTRACLRARDGHTFILADFAAVEARALAWAAGDAAALEDFRVGDPYRTLAARLYGIAPDLITKQQRQLGKVAILGAGYGLGNAEKFEALAAKPPYNVDWSVVPVTPADVLQQYRARFADTIVRFWRETQDAAVLACDGYTTTVGPYTWGPSPIRPRGFRGGHGDVWCMLPSGRPIVYYEMRYEMERRGPSLSFLGRRGPDRTYGGKAVENIVQGLCRDLLGEALVRCEAEGLPVVFHVHDEIVCEVPIAEAESGLARLIAIMSDTPSWAPGLPLKAEGHVTSRYVK
jgi:DNA polymerase bacteriophage-type